MQDMKLLLDSTHPQYSVHDKFAFLHPQRFSLQFSEQLQYVNFNAELGMPSLVMRRGFNPVSVISYPKSVASGSDGLGKIAFLQIIDWKWTMQCIMLKRNLRFQLPEVMYLH